MKPASRKNAIIHDWPRAGNFRRSIRFEFSLYVSLVVLALMLVTGWVMTDMYVSKTSEQVINEALVRVRSYSNTAGKLIISSENPDALLLNNLLKRLTEDYPDAYWAGIAAKDGVILAHTDIKKVIASEKLTPIESDRIVGLLADGEALNVRGDTINLMVPVTESGIQVGTLAMASSTHRIKMARSESIKTVVGITLLMMLIGIPATMLVLNRKLRPVSVITDHLKKVSVDNISLEIPVKSRNELGYLAKTLGVMGRRLNQAQKDMLERERMNRELEIAREIQANLLPNQNPTGDSFEIACFYRSAREVGGDYYDFIEFDDENLGIIVADVSGKSLPGMLVMLLTRDIIKSVSRHTIEPARLLTRVNAELGENVRKGMFVTMFYGVLNRATGELQFASAGHNPLVRFHADRTGHELIKTRGYPLGMVSSKQFADRIEQTRINLSAGDWVIQFTDGVNEAKNANSEEFGMDRFTGILESGRNLSPNEVTEKVVTGIDNFVEGSSQFDDITLLALKWSGLLVGNSDTKQRVATSVG
ncbi:MAG: PP2C family protein-serine/threonine phosphatase [Candidatus Zixiibacteriota bacterium]|nr:MAG: PP2C family protein-serine/threonine phosphatase [candidate division Zixibacteria bacterium]